MAELMRLRIPRGWAVLDNRFYDTEPTVKEGDDQILNREEGFSEDVLWIQECRVKSDTEYTVPEFQHYRISINWRPGNNISGMYCAVLHRCEQEALFEEEKFEGKNRFEVRDKIEYWMDYRDRTSDADAKQLLGSLTDKDLLPHYETIYTPDDVDMENPDELQLEENIDEWTCLRILANTSRELKADYNNYLLDAYKTLEITEERLPYLDIGNMAHFIIWKFKSNETPCFDKLFEHAEYLLAKGNESVKSLIVIGLFEGLQNVGGWHDVDYYSGFDRWLRPQSKKAWDELIEFWEGRKSNEK